MQQNNYNLRDLNFKEILGKVKAIIFDVDGVLSNSIVNFDNEGYLVRTTNVKDSYAIRYAIKKGLLIGIISGGFGESLENRIKMLGITNYTLKSKRKIIDFEIFVSTHKLKYEEILFMGDDIPDLEIMQKVGLPCCPNDAASEIKNISLYISKLDGGKGCARDVIEQVLRSQNKWMDDESFET